jgi:hypothetical protein
MPNPAESTDSIEQVVRAYDKNSEARAIAISYAFSNLDDRMGERNRVQSVDKETDDDLSGTPQGKDSWIDAELLAQRAVQISEDARREVVNNQPLTPRPALKESESDASQADVRKERSLKTVTFEEPEQAPAPADHGVQDDLAEDGEWCSLSLGMCMV